jgi:hypothetical protein
MNTQLKKQLYQKCLDFVQQRIDHIEQANKNASDSVKEETKSSSGDKHETGRAMAQLEQEKNGKALAEALELQVLVAKINPLHFSEKILPGSLVITDRGNFYISISAGKIFIDKEIYFAVSPASPIAAKLMGLKKRDIVAFNGQRYEIINVL